MRLEFDLIVKAKNHSTFLKDDLKLENNVKQNKKRLLEKVIFPSMANIVVFFEALEKHPEIRESFENDIKELFGFMKGNKDNQSIYNNNIWMRFVNSVLTWDEENDKNNFRLELISELQQIIVNRVTSLSIVKLGEYATVNLVQNDIIRAMVWTKMLASSYLDTEWERDQKTKPSRPVNF